MGQDIFVAALCLVAAAAGIWCWWIDNGSSWMERKNSKNSKKAELSDEEN